MNEKLNKLFYECIKELEKIGIDILNEDKIGKIDISISKRKVKRYGCCKQEEPDKNTVYYLNGRKYFKKFLPQSAEFSKPSPWGEGGERNEPDEGEPSADGRGSAPPELAEQQARAGSEAAPATPPL